MKELSYEERVAIVEREIFNDNKLLCEALEGHCLTEKDIITLSNLYHKVDEDVMYRLRRNFIDEIKDYIDEIGIMSWFKKDDN